MALPQIVQDINTISHDGKYYLEMAREHFSPAKFQEIESQMNKVWDSLPMYKQQVLNGEIVDKEVSEQISLLAGFCNKAKELTLKKIK